MGGNGYIGRNVTERWLEADPQAQFYVVSRSGKNELSNSRIHNISADVSSFDLVVPLLPADVDDIVDFVSRPENDDEAFVQVNDKPADVMLRIAREKDVTAMGFIGGLLGPQKFLDGKKRIADKLRSSGIRTEVVEPTVVYGNGRDDAPAKMVPVFKFFGLFSKNMKPVLISNVADEMVSKMLGE